MWASNTWRTSFQTGLWSSSYGENHANSRWMARCHSVLITRFRWVRFPYLQPNVSVAELAYAKDLKSLIYRFDSDQKHQARSRIVNKQTGLHTQKELFYMGKTKSYLSWLALETKRLVLQTQKLILLKYEVHLLNKANKQYFRSCGRKIWKRWRENGPWYWPPVVL